MPAVGVKGRGVWCLVFGVWCLVGGVWCLVGGVSLTEHARQQDRGRAHDAEALAAPLHVTARHGR